MPRITWTDIKVALSLAISPVSGRLLPRRMAPFRAAFRLAAARDAPIFVCGASFRTGSTAVQRLLLETGEVFIWGEPFGPSVLVRRLAETFLGFGRWMYASDDHFISSRFSPLRGLESRDFGVSNLYPEVDDLLEAHRCLFRRLFKAPAEAMGYSRWGIKDVRYSAFEIRYLHLLFPRAKFVFLVRNPLDGWQSFRAHLPIYWFDEWDFGPILTPWAYGRHWKKQAMGFIEVTGEVDSLILRLEDLNESVSDLSNHLRLDLNERVLRRRVGSTRTASMPPWERLAVRLAVGDVAATFDY